MEPRDVADAQRVGGCRHHENFDGARRHVLIAYVRSLRHVAFDPRDAARSVLGEVFVVLGGDGTELRLHLTTRTRFDFFHTLRVAPAGGPAQVGDARDVGQ